MEAQLGPQMPTAQVPVLTANSVKSLEGSTFLIELMWSPEAGAPRDPTLLHANTDLVADAE